MLKLWHNWLISHTIKVMLNILQASLQQYMNHETPDVQAAFRKDRGTRNHMPTSTGSWKKWEFQKNIYFCFIDYVKAFDCVQFSSVHFSCSVMSDSLWPHESQHVRPPCPSPTPGVHSDSHPLSQWCHLTISSSVIPFSSCPQSLPASESFPMSQLFAWGGQSTGVSASASFPPKKSQGWYSLEWTGWISLQSKGLSSLLQHHSSKASILWRSAFFTIQLSHLYMTTGKIIALTRSFHNYTFT